MNKHIPGTGPLGGGAQRGFTLLEVLVAFLLAAMLLAVILSGFSSGLSGLVRTERLAQAALLAQSRVAELGVSIPLEEGEASGNGEDDFIPFRWRVLITPFTWDYSADLHEQGMRLMRVDIEVFWPGIAGEHSYQLSTLRAVQEVVEP